MFLFFVSKIEFFKVAFSVGSDSSTVVEYSPHFLKIEGSNPVRAAEICRENDQYVVFSLILTNIVLLTCGTHIRLVRFISTSFLFKI
jgi:hypothetical protein